MEAHRAAEKYRQLAVRALRISLNKLYQVALRLKHMEIRARFYVPPPSFQLSAGVTWPLFSEGSVSWTECRVGRAGFVRVDEAADVIFERCMLEPELLVQSIKAIEEATRWCYKAMEEIADAKRGHV